MATILKLKNFEFNVSPILNSGSLILFDGALSLAGISTLSGVTSIKNLASGKAATLLSANRTLLDLPFTNTYTSEASVVISPKKAIDTVVTVVNQVGANIGWSMAFPDLIKTYMQNNLGHLFYFEAWHVLTRKVAAPTPIFFVGQ